MKLLNLPRASGKTTRLIYKAEDTGMPIIVNNKSSVDYIKEMSARLGCKDIQVYSVDDLVNPSVAKHLRGKRVLIDEINYFSENLLYKLFGIAVDTATISSKCSSEEKTAVPNEIDRLPINSATFVLRNGEKLQVTDINEYQIEAEDICDYFGKHTKFTINLTTKITKE